MLTKRQIILETVEYYKNNPRSVDENGYCRYLGPNGARCAMSRLMKDEYVTETLEGHSAETICYIHHDWIKPEYQGYIPQFYQQLQYFHDNVKNGQLQAEVYWEKTETGNKLTEEGNKRVEELLEMFKN